MQNTDDRGEETRDEITLDTAEPQMRPRDGDRRKDTAALFGGYQGPERRSGRDRRASP